MVDTKTTRGLLLRIDGSKEVVWSKGAKPCIDELYRWLKCEMVCSAPVRAGLLGEHGITGYCDDIGMYEKDPNMWWSSQLAALCGTRQVLFGDILLFGPGDDEGYDCSFPEELVDTFREYPNG